MEVTLRDRSPQAEEDRFKLAIMQVEVGHRGKEAHLIEVDPSRNSIMQVQELVSVVAILLKNNKS